MAQFKKGQSGNPGGRPKGADYLQNAIDRVYGGSDCKITECEVRERFRILNDAYGWFDICLSQEGFPDIVGKRDNKIIRIEVETISKNFIAHKHPLDECDLIVCWKHNWINCPKPVMEIAMEWANYQNLKKVKCYATINSGKRFGELDYS